MRIRAEEAKTLDGLLKEIEIIGLEESSSQGFRASIAKHLKYLMGSGKQTCHVEPQKAGVVRV